MRQTQDGPGRSGTHVSNTWVSFPQILDPNGSLTDLVFDDRRALGCGMFRFGILSSASHAQKWGGRRASSFDESKVNLVDRYASELRSRRQ